MPKSELRGTQAHHQHEFVATGERNCDGQEKSQRKDELTHSIPPFTALKSTPGGSCQSRSAALQIR